MLTDYFEPFTLLKSASCPDPCGGQLQQDVTELPFRAALADALGEEGERGGKPFIRMTPYLLCPPETPLKLDDIIRREKDGAHYRVCSRPEDGERRWVQAFLTPRCAWREWRRTHDAASRAGQPLFRPAGRCIL